MSAMYYITWSLFSLQLSKTCNSQKDSVTEQEVMSKLSYWYIRDVCSMASRVKGYKALPLLTFRCRGVGRVPGKRGWPNSSSSLVGPVIGQNVHRVFWRYMLTWFTPASTAQLLFISSHNLFWLHVQFEGAWQHILHSSWIAKWRLWGSFSNSNHKISSKFFNCQRFDYYTVSSLCI